MEAISCRPKVEGVGPDEGHKMGAEDQRKGFPSAAEPEQRRCRNVTRIIQEAEAGAGRSSPAEDWIEAWSCSVSLQRTSRILRTNHASN